MRRRRSFAAVSVILKATVKMLGFVFLPLVVLYGLSDRASLHKRNARFAADIADAFAGLIAKHGGVVSPGLVAERGGAFDYVEASLEFADRTLRFVRGRGDLTVSCNGSPVFSADAGALFRSATFVEQHWSELLQADYDTIQRWLRGDA